MDLPSRTDLFTVARRYIKAQPNLRINPALVDVPGSDLNLAVGQTAVMGESLVAAWAKCARGLFVDTAVGDQLDRKVFDSFGMTRKPANPATADLLLARPTFAAAGGTVPAGTRVQTSFGSVFSLQTDVVFGATDLSKTGSGVAAIVGPTQNVPIDTLKSFVDAPFDATITVTNTTAGAGGTDRESDAQLRGRARVFFLTLRRGTLQAIQYAATLVPGVSVSTAFEIENPGTALPAGAVELIIADDNGFASGAMIQATLDMLLQFRCCGIPVFVFTGDVVFTTVSFKLAFETGVDTVAAAEEVRAVTVAFSQFLRPGQTLLESDLAACARAVPGVIFRDDSLVIPVGDIVPTSNTQIIRVRPEDIVFV